MLKAALFAHYALRFERAYKTDRWDAVGPCFTEDAVYSVFGAPPFDGVTRGRDAIVAGFRRVLDDVDRRFDRRQPRLTGWPRVRGGELQLGWSVRYRLGAEHADLTGETRCRFVGTRISELSDVMPADECQNVFALLSRA